MSLGRSNDYYQLARHITALVKCVCEEDEDGAHSAALAAKILLNDTDTVISESFTKFQMNLVFLEFFNLVIGTEQQQQQQMDAGWETTCLSFFRDILGENNLLLSDICESCNLLAILRQSFHHSSLFLQLLFLFLTLMLHQTLSSRLRG